MKFSKIKNVKVSETVAHKILNMIKDGVYKPGDKIPTEEEFILFLEWVELQFEKVCND